jgi:hypothetical protein
VNGVWVCDLTWADVVSWICRESWCEVEQYDQDLYILTSSNELDACYFGWELNDVCVKVHVIANL